MEIPRLFTLEEAHALLPRVRELMENMQAKKGEADTARIQFEKLGLSHASGNGYDMQREALATRIAEKMRALRLDLEEIHKIGCVVKDIDMGLVDFPAIRDGQVVNLCWRLGEDRISFWHSLDTGFGSRQPL